jgi:tripartite-type tricarboxylate transporter receptor subunit TctC
MLHIPYSGAAPAQIGLLAGQTDLMFDNLASATQQIKASKLRALAVTTASRTPFFSDLPTIAESGLANFDISTWFGIFGPANLPAAITSRLNEELTRAMESSRCVRKICAKRATKVCPGN